MSSHTSRIKPSVFKFGRRTGVEVLKGKKVRKRKDGTEVFNDYWTDSEYSISNADEIDQVKNKSMSRVMNKSQNSKIKGLVSESSSEDNSDSFYVPSPQLKSQDKNASKAHITNSSLKESNVNPDSVKKKLNFDNCLHNNSNKNKRNSFVNLNEDINLNNNKNDGIINDFENEDVLNEDENRDILNENEDDLNEFNGSPIDQNLNIITSTPKTNKNKTSVKKLISKKIASKLVKSSAHVKQTNTKQNQSMNKKVSKNVSFKKNLISRPDKESSLSLGAHDKIIPHKNTSNISNHLDKASTSQAFLNSSLQRNSKHTSKINQVSPSNKNNSKIKINKISTKINVKKKAQSKLNTKNTIRRSPRKNKQVSYSDKKTPKNSVIYKDGLEIEYSPVDENPINNADDNFENVDIENHQNNNDDSEIVDTENHQINNADDNFEIDDENAQNGNVIDNLEPDNSYKMQNIAHPNKKRKATKTQIKKPRNKKSLLTTNVSNESNNVRRSNRRRFPPLAHWRNERARYKFLSFHNIEFMGIEQGSSFATNDNKKLNKPKNNRKKSLTSDVQYPVLDITIQNQETQETNKAQIVKPFSCLQWIHPLSKNPNYSIAKLFETQDVTYGILKIKSMQKKTLQFLPDDDIVFCLIKGTTQVLVHETTFLVKEKDSFLIPQGNSYEISNIKKQEAILFYSTIKYSLLNGVSCGV